MKRQIKLLIFLAYFVGFDPVFTLKFAKYSQRIHVVFTEIHILHNFIIFLQHLGFNKRKLSD